MTEDYLEAAQALLADISSRPGIQPRPNRRQRRARIKGAPIKKSAANRKLAR